MLRTVNRAAEALGRNVKFNCIRAVTWNADGEGEAVAEIEKRKMIEEENTDG